MPPLAAEFGRLISEALALSEAGEIVRAHANPGSPTKAALSAKRLEYLYEMAYLRAFVAWEAFLEQAFYRYLCGYTSPRGPMPRIGGAAYCATLATAETTVLNGMRYRLWHNPGQVIARCQRYFVAGTHFEAVLGSATARIADMANVRHRIAHAQRDAIVQFNAATLRFAGRQYSAASAGRFLRDWVPGKTPPERWLAELTRELGSLAGQIA